MFVTCWFSLTKTHDSFVSQLSLLPRQARPITGSMGFSQLLEKTQRFTRYQQLSYVFVCVDL